MLSEPLPRLLQKRLLQPDQVEAVDALEQAIQLLLRHQLAVRHPARRRGRAGLAPPGPLDATQIVGTQKSEKRLIRWVGEGRVVRAQVRPHPIPERRLLRDLSGRL